MVGGNNFRKSQFNLAVQGERQPGSSFAFRARDRASARHRTGTTLVSKPITLYLDGTYWPVSNYEGSYLDHRPAAGDDPPDNSVYAQLTRIVGPGNAAHRAQARDREPARAVPVDRPRRAGGQPARDGTRVLGACQRRVSHRRLDRQASQPSAGDPRGRPQDVDQLRLRRPRGGLQQAQSEARAASGHGGAENSILQRVVTRARPSCRTARIAQPPARRARPRTTATPGSSATRHSS